MILYAIDPGERQSGWVLFDGKTVLDSGVHDNGDMLTWIRAGQGADVLAIEMAEAWAGAKVWRQVFTTVRWAGRMQQCWRDPDAVCFVTRAEVKRHLLGKMAGNDGQIRQALMEAIGEPGTKRAPGPTHGVTSHAWAALAVAVTAMHQLGQAVEAQPAPLFREPETQRAMTTAEVFGVGA